MLMNRALERRVNYKHWDTENIPTRDQIQQIIDEAIKIAPIKNEYFPFNIDVYGPEHAEQKKWVNLATTTKRQYKLENYDGEEEDWWDEMESLYEKKPDFFNTQVLAPWVLNITKIPYKDAWNPKSEQRGDDQDPMMAGIFMYALSLTANNHEIDAAFCLCFDKDITTKDLFINDYGKTGFGLVCLGIYKFPGETYENNGQRYDTLRRKKIRFKRDKPTVDRITNWK